MTLERASTAAERLAVAKRTAADLHRKLTFTEEKIAKLTAQRAEMSLAAHMGNGEAQALVAEINEDLIEPRREVETLAEAIARAELLVTAAADPKHVKEERQIAEHCIKIDAEACGHANKADKALAQFVEHFNQYREAMIELHREGYAPSTLLFDSNARSALASSLMLTALKFEHVAPTSRRTFTDMAENYSRTVHGQAARRLGEKAKAA